MSPSMTTAPVSIARLWAGLVLGWIVPGAGHALLGRRDKAVFFGVLVIGCFVAGLWMAEFRCVHAEKHALYLLAQIWAGGPTLLALLTTAQLRVTHDIAWFDAGLLYTAVAGLLNLVVLVDLYETYLKANAASAPAVAPAPAATKGPRA